MKEAFRLFLRHNAFKISFAICIVAAFGYILIPFIIPLLMGGIFAMALVPFLDYLGRKGIGRDNSLVIISISLGALILTPAVAFFLRGSRMVNALMQDNDISSLTSKSKQIVYRLIERFCDLYGFDEVLAKKKFNALAAAFGEGLSKVFADFMVSLPEILMGILITMLAAYFFLKESVRIRRLFDRYFNFSPDHGDRFIQMVKLGCQEVFVTNIVTGVVQASIVSIGGIVSGVGDFYLTFFITFIFSFIPVLGAAPVAATMAVASFIDQRTVPGITLLVVAGIAGVSDNVLRPYLASRGDVSVHPFIGFLAVIGGVIMLGLPGLFLGPLLASLCFGALPIIIEEYYPSERVEIGKTHMDLVTKI